MRGNLETWGPSQHSLVDTGKPRKTCVEVAGRFIIIIIKPHIGA
jgi:hypothetical protein